MRIRKHSKISTLFLSSSSEFFSDSLLTSRICLLNQSPWDVIDFSPPDSPPPPPPPFQEFHQSQQLDVNESFSGNVASVDSVVAVESVDSLKLGNHCSKNDGKQWHCKRETNVNESMCDYHLAQRNSSHVSVSNKTVRARKSAMKSSNPNDFYYYSGFGPTWGKKRDSTVSSVSEAAKVTAVSPSNYSSTEIDDDVDDEDDDDDDEEDRVNGIKRRRKPMKARSLKDLCY